VVKKMRLIFYQFRYVFDRKIDDKNM